MHGLVLLNQSIEFLFVTALIHEVASVRRGRPHGKSKLTPRRTRGALSSLTSLVFSWSLTRRCPQDPQSDIFIVSYIGKSPSGSPGPLFYITFCGPTNGPLGGRSALLGSPGGSAPAVRVTKTVVSSRRHAHFHKTVRSIDRMVALPGRSNLTPRLRGEVDLRGAGGGGTSATVPYGIAVFEAEKKGPDDQVSRPFCESERFASTKCLLCRQVRKPKSIFERP